MEPEHSPTAMPRGDALMHFHGMLLGLLEVTALLLQTHPDSTLLQKALPQALERLEVIHLNAPIPDGALAVARATVQHLLAQPNGSAPAG